MAKDDHEAIIKMVYVRLNPIVRMLCEAVKEWNSSTESRNRSRRLGILRTVSDLVEQLSNTLLQLAAVGDSTAQQHFSAAVANMADFVTLPLLAILRLAGTFDDKSCWDQTTNETQRIGQSAVWKCIEGSSRCFQVMIHMVSSGKATLPNSKIIKYLRTLAEVLPSRTQVAARQSESARLDSGEACLGRLHEAIQSLVKLASQNSSLGNDIASDMNGGLMARILDSAIAVVEPSVSASRGSSESSTLQLKALTTSTLQLKALTTIACSMENVPNIGVWRSVFPGIYIGMYRRILQSIRVSNVQQTSKQVVIRCVANLTQLLELTLNSRSKQQQVASTVLKNLKSLVIATNTRSLPTIAGATENNAPEAEFFLQVNQRLPATLSVLINMLTAAQSSKLREQAIGLNRVLLLKTRSCWNEISADDLARTTLESCLVLCSDGDSDVASEAEKLVRVYSKDSISIRDANVVVVPRVISLIKRLPSLAQSAHEMELQASLKLITGYLSMIKTDSFLAKGLRSSLSNEGVAESLRRSLCMILDVNFDACDMTNSNVLVLATDGIQNSSVEPRLKYMQERSAQQTYRMIHALGKALGPKEAALCVDACIAGLYKACVARVENGLSLDGYSQIQWLHENIGFIILAEQLLIGCFSCAGGDDDTTKDKRKSMRVLSALAQSILPIVISHPLWDLPARPSDTCDSKLGVVSSFLLTSEDNSSTRGAVAGAQRGNVTISCLLLGLVGTITELLGYEVQRFVPILLYPILEKSGQGCVAVVRDEANLVLQKVAVACGSSDVSILMADNMESSLLGPMLEKIRVAGGRMPSPGDQLDSGLLSIVECAVTVLRITADAQSQRPVEGESLMLSYMQELTSSLIVRFDHIATNVTNEQDKTLIFLKLFNAALLLLMASYDVQVCGTRSTTTEQSRNAESEPWFELLAPYETQPPMGPRRGFTVHFDQKRYSSERLESDDILDMTRVTSFVSQITWRSGYLLSHPSLKVQVQSCNVLVHCFNFLGWVAMNQSVQNDQANGPKTAILRQIHSSWPAIGARLTATCTAATVSKGTSLVTPPLQSSSDSLLTNIGKQRVYLSNLLSLVAAMTECAGDFMAGRFREVVWPCIGKIIRSFPTTQRNGTHLLNQRPQLLSCYTESEQNLLLGAIRCLSRVFGHQPAGRELSGLIPEAGSLLFPFLEHENKLIVSACTRALEAMLRVDCDCLWRPLVEMSGSTLPACPLNNWSSSENRTEPSPHSEKLAIVSKQLISFVESLSEQPLY